MTPGPSDQHAHDLHELKPEVRTQLRDVARARTGRCRSGTGETEVDAS